MNMNLLNIKSSIANGLKQVQLLRSELGSCKRLLFLKKKGVSNSWMKKLESETLCDMVENVKSVIQMSDTIVSLTQQYDFLAASEKVKEIDTQLSNDPRLMTIVGDFRKKFDEKIAILTKEVIVYLCACALMHFKLFIWCFFVLFAELSLEKS